MHRCTMRHPQMEPWTNQHEEQGPHTVECATRCRHLANRLASGLAACLCINGCACVCAVYQEQVGISGLTSSTSRGRWPGTLPTGVRVQCALDARSRWGLQRSSPVYPLTSRQRDPGRPSPAHPYTSLVHVSRAWLGVRARLYGFVG